ncbi:MAG TPA: winged helix-turn-helix domain-containing protein [Solirubrobacterales bacterium]|jgi:DNA-binding transcriptional ArsR family regulator|nr:winged helix-turn-helix domain-containing protein [Solirubrobacterales bacterium]
MESDISALPPDLRAALVESLGDPLRAQIYIAISERPGATIAQIATRIGAPDRKVRRRVNLLVEAELVVVDSEILKGNARERHYRAVVLPSLIDEVDGPWTDEERQKLALSMIRQIFADVDRAIRNRTFGLHVQHTEARVPGEVDEQGWEELGQIMLRATREIEASMKASAARLEAAGRNGDEVVAALLLFEGAPWGHHEDDHQGLRPSPWLPPDG